jgi:hypothetical protein
MSDHFNLNTHASLKPSASTTTGMRTRRQNNPMTSQSNGRSANSPKILTVRNAGYWHHRITSGATEINANMPTNTARTSRGILKVIRSLVSMLQRPNVLAFS